MTERYVFHIEVTIFFERNRMSVWLRLELNNFNSRHDEQVFEFYLLYTFELGIGRLKKKRQDEQVSEFYLLYTIDISLYSGKKQTNDFTLFFYTIGIIKRTPEQMYTVDFILDSLVKDI